MEQIAGMQVSCILKATLQNSLDGNTVLASAEQGFEFAPTPPGNGTDADQGDRIWADVDRVLGDGTSETIDLFDLGALDIGAGAGRSALGQAVQFAEICGLLIVVSSGSAGSILIGGEGSAAAFNALTNGSDTAVIGPVGPGGCRFFYERTNPALAVADGSNHLLKIAATGGDATYSIAVFGRSS